MAAKKQIFDEKQHQKVDCAHMECSNPAIARIQTKTGWANVCMKHYDQHYREIAEEKCVELGLLTNKDCRQWVKENGLKIKRFAA